MRTLKRLTPTAAGIFFAAVTGITIFVNNPVLRAVSLIFAALSAVLCGLVKFKELAGYMTFAAVVAVLNPIFVTSGGTALFRIADRPYTLEALIYGMSNGLALAAAVLWFKLLGAVFDTQRVNAALAAFGKNGGAAATVFALTLRYIPELKRRYRSICDARRAAGEDGGEAYILRLKASLSAFLSLTASSLELSASSADSMKARGYMLSPHTFLEKQAAGAADLIAAGLSAAGAAGVAACSLGGSLYANFYPKFQIGCPVWCACGFAAVCALPLIFCAREEFLWALSRRGR